MELEVLEVTHVHLHYFWPQQTLITETWRWFCSKKIERTAGKWGFFLSISSFLNWYPSVNHAERWGFLSVFCFWMKFSILFGFAVSNLQRFTSQLSLYLWLYIIEVSRQTWGKRNIFFLVHFCSLFSINSKASKILLLSVSEWGWELKDADATFPFSSHYSSTLCILHSTWDMIFCFSEPLFCQLEQL